MKHMPKFISPDTDTSPQQLVNIEVQLLSKKSHDGLSERLTSFATAASKAIYTKRLDKELQIIEDKNACGYYLIVADYVNWARAKGIAVGPGRGSGPCSLAGFVLGITQVDPIKYNLPCERFLNPDRDWGPDFDLEFCNERRSEVLTYIQKRYGYDQVAHISSAQATPLESRLVIGDRPLVEVIPLHPDSNQKIPATTMTIKQISDAGLVQFNVINQNALSVIQNSTQQLANKGVVASITNAPLDDKLTYSLLSTGYPSSITILDGDDYRTALIAVQPSRFEELYAVIGMCRPDHRKNIPLYVARKRASPSPDYMHPALKSITKETYGLIIYQEQIIHIAHEIAGLTLAQGDLLRRALLKSNSQAKQNYKVKFIDGAVSLGMSSTEALNIFEHISIACPACFNKSHAVAYAMIAYQTAWLKTRE